MKRLRSCEGSAEGVQYSVTRLIEFAYDELHQLDALLLRTEHGASGRSGSIGRNRWAYRFVCAETNNLGNLPFERSLIGGERG